VAADDDNEKDEPPAPASASPLAVDSAIDGSKSGTLAKTERGGSAAPTTDQLEKMSRAQRRQALQVTSLPPSSSSSSIHSFFTRKSFSFENV
jgi:hypothetical protein